MNIRITDITALEITRDVIIFLQMKYENLNKNGSHTEECDIINQMLVIIDKEY